MKASRLRRHDVLSRFVQLPRASKNPYMEHTLTAHNQNAYMRYLLKQRYAPYSGSDAFQTLRTSVPQMVAPTKVKLSGDLAVSFKLLLRMFQVAAGLVTTSSHCSQIRIAAKLLEEDVLHKEVEAYHGTVRWDPFQSVLMGLCEPLCRSAALGGTSDGASPSHVMPAHMCLADVIPWAPHESSQQQKAKAPHLALAGSPPSFRTLNLMFDGMQTGLDVQQTKGSGLEVWRPHHRPRHPLLQRPDEVRLPA